MVAFLGAVVPGTPATRITSAIVEFTFTAGAIALAVCNRNNKGVRIFYINVAGTVFCRQH
jgi:hypothetical protein